MNEKVHKFEEVGLGKAPFNFIGWFEGKARADESTGSANCTNCAYCSTAIKSCFRLESSDGRTFIVGSECVKKTGDAGLMKVVNQEVTKQKWLKEEERINNARKLLKDKTIQDKLYEIPSPVKEGSTMFDYVYWMIADGYGGFGYAGHSGRFKAAKIIEKHYEIRRNRTTNAI